MRCDERKETKTLENPEYDQKRTDVDVEMQRIMGLIGKYLYSEDRKMKNFTYEDGQKRKQT